MAEPVTFSGIDKVISANFTNSTGVEPSVCILDVLTQNISRSTGTLTFTHGDTVRFSDCLIADPHLISGYKWRLKVLDRRWKWREFGSISGEYNVHRGGKVDSSTEKTPAQLLKLIFEALGETEYDLSKVPDRQRVNVDWDNELPVEALRNVVRRIGCRVVLDAKDRIVIWPLGKGSRLPRSGDAVFQVFPFRPFVSPDQVVIRGGPTLVESNLSLTAVGLGYEQGELDHILQEDGDNKLGHLPSTGFDGKPPDHWIAQFFPKDTTEPGKTTTVNDSHVWGAAQSFYRWYQIWTQADGSLSIPGLPKIKVDKISQIFPVRSTRASVYTDIYGRSQEMPAHVLGEYYGRTMFPHNTAKDARYAGDFTLDADLGLVKFDYPVYRVASDFVPEVPDLYLRTSYGVRDEKNQRVHFEHSIQAPGERSNVQPLVIERPELQEVICVEYKKDSPNKVKNINTNRPEIQSEADKLLQDILAQWRGEPAEQVSYGTIKAISPDGLVAQVRFEIGARGVLTTASSRTEFDVTTYSELDRESHLDARAAARRVGV